MRGLKRKREAEFSLREELTQFRKRVNERFKELAKDPVFMAKVDAEISTLGDIEALRQYMNQYAVKLSLTEVKAKKRKKRKRGK